MCTTLIPVGFKPKANLKILFHLLIFVVNLESEIFKDF